MAAACVGALLAGAGVTSNVPGVLRAITSAASSVPGTDDSVNVVKVAAAGSVDRSRPGVLPVVKPRSAAVAKASAAATVALSGQQAPIAGSVLSVRTADPAVAKAAVSRTADGAAATAKAAVGRGGATGGASPSSVTVKTLDPTLFKGFGGGQGVAFTVERADDTAAAGDVTVQVDYAAFADAFGGAFKDRLRLVAYPACVVTTPEVAACRVPVPIPSVNDAKGETLTATVSAAAPGTASLTPPVVTNPVTSGTSATAGTARPGSGYVPKLPAQSTNVPKIAARAAAAATPSASATSSSSTTAAAAATAPAATASAAATPSASPSGSASAGAMSSPSDSPSPTTSPSPGSSASPNPSASGAAAKTTASAAPASLVGGSVVFALAAGAAGTDSTFAASSLKASGSWAVGLQSGSFDYTYPIKVPPSTGGEAPELALAYSSSRADGYVANENGQASQVGLGWELPIPFIERKFADCTGNDVGSKCWAGQNATISIDGKTATLIQTTPEKDAGGNPLPVASFAMDGDQGYRIERVYGYGDNVNGDDIGFYWKVTDTSGTQYFFGRENTAWQTSANNSTLSMPVLHWNPGDPCYGGWFTCTMAWRWNLSYIVDPNGNIQTYRYQRSVLTYEPWPGTYWDYDGDAVLIQVGYGRRTDTVKTGGPAQKIELAYRWRCNRLAAGVPPGQCDDANLPDVNHPEWYPDIPFDIACWAFNGSSWCGNGPPHEMVFYSLRRLDATFSYVRQAASTYQQVDTTFISGDYQMVGTDYSTASLTLNSVAGRRRQHHRAAAHRVRVHDARQPVGR